MIQLIKDGYEAFKGMGSLAKEVKATSRDVVESVKINGVILDRLIKKPS